MDRWQAWPARCATTLVVLLSLQAILGVAGHGPLTALVLGSAAALVLLAGAVTRLRPPVVVARRGTGPGVRHTPEPVAAILTDPTSHPRRPRAPGRR